jgi:hypothetical protein
MVRTLATVGFALAALLVTRAQDQLSPADVVRVDAAMRAAFAFLYALPSDTSAARMGTWVLDSAATTASDDPAPLRRILVTNLSDTGRDLKFSEMVGSSGTSPVELAAAMVAMQRLEGKISKAEAEAAIEIVIAVNEPEISLAGISDEAQRSKPAIPGAELVMRVHGDWIRLDDRDLEIDYERWSPATLIAGFGGFAPIETRRRSAKESLATFTAHARPAPGRSGLRTLAVTAQGNEQMLDRVIKETRWEALAALVK